MNNKLRTIPPVCLVTGLAGLVTDRLRMLWRWVGATVVRPDGDAFRIFRNIEASKRHRAEEPYVFVVSFKFARLSHRANKVISLLPMLLIAGSPGFIQKMYGVNDENGYWQGMYEWRSKEHMEAYKKSLVFRMMKKRAFPGSLQMEEHGNSTLSEYLREHLAHTINIQLM